GANFDPSVANIGGNLITYSFTDGNTCSNTCTFTITVNQATAWYQDSEPDGLGDLNNSVMACSQPAGYVADNTDSCPTQLGVIGSACDAGPGFILGALDANCVCVGVPCTENVTMQVNTDANPQQTTWEIRSEVGAILVCSGGPYTGLPNAVITTNCCLPVGCYKLTVFDVAGDGITNGGYTLRTTGSNKRIIDNSGNFTTGTSSSVAGTQSFCVPIGADALIYTSCDKLDWVNAEYIVATENASVSAQWLVGDQTDDGYEMWFFNPNGGYSFRRFHSHAVSDGFGPANATRACHIRINNWAVANQIPANVLMNARVRSRVNGVNASWGPACKFKIDPVRALCPLTKLMDIPGNPYLSCGSTRAWGAGNYVHARPVTGANKYQFRFRIDGENFVTVRTVTTYFVQLNWTVNPLQDGKTYQVEVRASKDNGATWCIDVPTPVLGPPFTQWGDVCDLTIDNTPVGAGNQNFVPEGATLRMYPNPNHGDQLYLSLDAVEEGVLTVSVDIYDFVGKRVSARTIPVQDGFINTVLDLDGDMASGVYMVNITAGDQRFTERLVIQK
ncbi:MAG TPA: T9SS type A sorting domain-containing protein, partial [Flavobacteriales bacterium]|nr:T9SS type A sorting domain-containing protein [Flavobacteriales bacterium]